MTDNDPTTIHPVDLLAALERGQRSEAFIRHTLLQRITNLTALLNLDRQPDGITFAALGALQYCVRQLQLSYSSRDLDDLEERFAEVELQNYPTSQEELERSKKRYEELGLALSVDTCRFGKDAVRYRITSPIEQMGNDGIERSAGDLLPSIDAPTISLFNLYGLLK